MVVRLIIIVQFCLLYYFMLILMFRMANFDEIFTLVKLLFKIIGSKMSNIFKIFQQQSQTRFWWILISFAILLWTCVNGSAATSGQAKCEQSITYNKEVGEFNMLLVRRIKLPIILK